jgi:hypothetical protein
MIRDLALLLCLLPIVAMGQVTTDEEYNYLSKGYQIQMESGLDMKKGYSIKLLDATALTIEGKDLTAQFSGLYREGSERPCAFLVTVMKSGARDRLYLAIPSHDAPKEMWDRAFQDLNNRLGQLREAMGIVLVGFMHFATVEASRGGPSLYDAGRSTPVVLGDAYATADEGACSGRQIIKHSAPAGGHQEEGLVMVDVWIDRSGSVVRAKASLESPTNTLSADLTSRAIAAARLYKFSASDTAPAEQKCELPFRFSLR